MSKIILDGSAFADVESMLHAWAGGAVLHTLSDSVPFTIGDGEILHRRRLVWVRMADGTHARIEAEGETVSL